MSRERGWQREPPVAPNLDVGALSCKTHNFPSDVWFHFILLPNDRREAERPFVNLVKQAQEIKRRRGGSRSYCGLVDIMSARVLSQSCFWGLVALMGTCGLSQILGSCSFGAWLSCCSTPRDGLFPVWQFFHQLLQPMCHSGLLEKINVLFPSKFGPFEFLPPSEFNEGLDWKTGISWSSWKVDIELELCHQLEWVFFRYRHNRLKWNFLKLRSKNNHRILFVRHVVLVKNLGRGWQ